MYNNFCHKKILIFGCGKMGRAILENLINHCNYNSENILICKKNIDKPIAINNISIKSTIITNLDKNNFTADIVFICIKPQDSQIIIEELLAQKNCYHQNTIFISILAGKKLDFFNKILLNNSIKKPKIIRTMPNIGLYYQAGILPYLANHNVENNELESIVKNIFTNFGSAIMLDKEEDFDIFTAIFGSGPALIFYLQKIFNDIAIKYNIKHETSSLLIKQLFFGSAIFAKNNNQNSGNQFDYLISQIASKGGTTEEAIKIMQDNHQELEAIINLAIDKAITKSQKLAE